MAAVQLALGQLAVGQLAAGRDFCHVTANSIVHQDAGDLGTAGGLTGLRMLARTNEQSLNDFAIEPAGGGFLVLTFC
jgi:hypothetical protein